MQDGGHDAFQKPAHTTHTHTPAVGLPWVSGALVCVDLLQTDVGGAGSDAAHIKTSVTAALTREPTLRPFAVIFQPAQSEWVCCSDR